MSDQSPERTDKGRPRPAGSGQTGSGQAGSTRTSTPAAKKVPAAKKAPADAQPAKKAATSASSSATSSSSSASSTAVIPAVKDEPAATSSTSTAPAPASAQSNQLGGGSGRAATLRLSHVDPWSVTRMAFAISVALMVVAVVAVAIFWLVLEALGIWDTVDNSVTSVLSDDTSAFSITDYLGFGRLVGLTLVLSALNVVIATVLATIGAHLYNLGAQVLGGFQVTYTSQD